MDSPFLLLPGMEEEESGLDELSSSTLDPQFVVFFIFLLWLLVIIYGWAVAVLPGRRGHRQARRRRRRDQWIYTATMKALGAFGACVRLLVTLIPLLAAVAAAARAAIAPAQPQLPDNEEEVQSQQSSAVKEEEVQSQKSSAVKEEEVQSQQSSTVEVQLQSQQSALEEGHSTTEEGFVLVNIWDTGSLMQCSRNMIDCFKKLNHPIHIAAARSPNGSGCSSPTQFDYTYRDVLPHKNIKDQCLPFRPLCLLDQGGICAIDPSKLAELEKMIHKQNGKPGHEQVLYDVFEDKSSVVDSFLFDCFNSVGLSIDAWTSMIGYESAKRYVMSLKVMAGLLCVMKSELDEVECVSFDQDLRSYYFKLCARQSIQNLIDAADSVSKLKWSASDIYQMLVLYEAIDDVLGAFSYPNGSNIIFQQMHANFKGIFDGIKNFIHADLNCSCEVTHDVKHDRHPMTYFLIHSMELFENHKHIVQRIFVADATSSLGNLLLEVIRDWAYELERHSDSYAEGGKYRFLLNNLSYFTWEIKPNSEFGKIIEFLESLISKYTDEYLVEYWGPVRKCVELSSGMKPCLSSLNEFMSQFEAIIDRQGTWVLETNLKYKLREEIKKYITPCYRTFLQELQLQELRKKALLRPIHLFWKHRSGQHCKYMTIEQLDNHVENLFESGA